jgi:Rod binding domain-containing protein
MAGTVLSLGPTLQSGINLHGSARKDDPEKIHHAAQQFESLLISQILKFAKSDESEGWLGTGDDQASGSAMSIAEEQLAQAIGARGGLGLTRLIERGLTKSTNANGQ